MATTVTLDEELVQLARRYTSDLDCTLAALLTEFVGRARAKEASANAMVDRQIEAWNAFHAEHGLLSDEFSML